MKWFISVVVFICVFITIVNGAKPSKQNKEKEISKGGLKVDSMIYEPGKTFLEEDIKNKKIICTGSYRAQKIEWYDPDGNLVDQDRSGVYYAETALSLDKASVSLVFSTTRVSETGVWECRSGEEVQEVPICIIDPPELEEDEDHTEEIDEGRSLTLSCNGNGYPEPRFEWYKDEDLLADDGERFFTSTKYNRRGLEGLLTIKSVDATDMGVYNCKIIQEYPDMDDCKNTVSTNITLNVYHAPKYLDDKNTFIPMFATDGENLTLNCNPSAYPTPEFRWFTANMAAEYIKKHIQVSSDNGTWSILPLVANSSTFDQEFICKAKNDFGELTVIFIILKAHKPSTLSATSEFNALERTLYFNITWDQDIDFPVEGFEIQYFEKVDIGEPRFLHWARVSPVIYEIETVVSKKYFEDDFLVPLRNLNFNTEYWVRIRAYNALGKASWSKNILASTAYEGQYDNAPLSGVPGTLIGVIGIAAIVVFAGGCIILIKKL